MKYFLKLVLSMEHELILALSIGVIFFIVKLITIRVNSKYTKEEKTELQRMVFRDSFIVIFISVIVMFSKKEFFNKRASKTPVFTNEPGF
jgi:formate hydrogenlyase subunit 4